MSAPLGPNSKLGNALREYEAFLVIRELDACKWNVTSAARNLGVHKDTIYRTLKGRGIKPRGRAMQTEALRAARSPTVDLRAFLNRAH